MIVDLSMYQARLALDDLPDHVSGVIIKATQGTFTDPQFVRFRQEAQDVRWKWVGIYHFLSDRGVQNEAAYFLNAVGALGPREFVVLDWENNAITGYRPPMADAVAWMQIVDAALPGRAAWYSYRSNAAVARQSGQFPWPLWLADPNPNGLEWAHTLDAFLLQSGQQILADINIDVNDIIDISVLDQLGYPSGQSSPLENDMPITDDDAKKIAEAVWARTIDARGFSAPAAQMAGSIYDEVRWPDNLQARIIPAITDAILAALPKAGAESGLTYDDVLGAVKSALKAQAAILAAT